MSGLTVSVVDGVATVTIDRPEKRNALTLDMWRSLGEICLSLGGDTSLRVVVVTGAGPSFCAGADIGSLSEDEATLRAVVDSSEQALRNLAVPTIAAIRGHCMGGGNQIAVACDLRICEETAVFAVPPAKLGVVYSVHSTRSLMELIGPAEAKRMLFTALPIDAGEALRIGLVSQVVPADELDAAVASTVAAMLPLSPMTQVAAKELLNLIADGGDADSAYADWVVRWRASPDGAEGPNAFLQRREPEFRWRREV